MKLVAWSSLFLAAVIAGILLGFTPVGAGLSEVSADILGSFIGIFAALALSEIVKEIENSLNAKRIHEDLVSSMEKMIRELTPEYPTRYDTTEWDAAFSSGEINLIQRENREKLYAIYRLIQLYNSKVDVFHTNKHDPDCNPDRRKLSKDVAITFQRDLIQKLTMFLELDS